MNKKIEFDEDETKRFDYEDYVLSVKVKISKITEEDYFSFKKRGTFYKTDKYNEAIIKLYEKYIANQISMEDLPEIDNFCDLQQWFNDYCEANKYTCWHNYGPADYTKYLAESVKILLINSESMGYEGCYKVSSDEYLKWIKKGGKTPRYGSILVALIREYIKKINENNSEKHIFDKNKISSYFDNVSILIKNMDYTSYMNARITSNDTGETQEDKENVTSNTKEFSAYRKKFVEILEPKIIICAGNSAADTIFSNYGVYPEANSTDAVFKWKNIIFVKTKQLGNPTRFGGYKELDNLAFKCAELYCRKSNF